MQELCGEFSSQVRYLWAHQQIKGELDAEEIYLSEEVERRCAVYFKSKQRQSILDDQAMHAALDPNLVKAYATDFCGAKVLRDCQCCSVAQMLQCLQRLQNGETR